MPDDKLIQYGCFGIVAALIVWVCWKVIPAALATHNAAVCTMTLAFETRCRENEAAFKSVNAAMLQANREETENCRAERERCATAERAERELDRRARHEAAQAINQVVLRIEDVLEHRVKG